MNAEPSELICGVLIAGRICLMAWMSAKETRKKEIHQ